MPRILSAGLGGLVTAHRALNAASRGADSPWQELEHGQMIPVVETVRI
jgi:hypothetical protein